MDDVGNSDLSDGDETHKQATIISQDAQLKMCYDDCGMMIEVEIREVYAYGADLQHLCGDLWD